MRKTTIAIGLVLVALTLSAAACGGDDDDGDSAAGTTTVATTTVDDETTTDGTTTSEDEGAALEGETGPGFEIKLRQDSEDVESIPAGTYTISVEDKSEMHNFHLMGPGVDEEITEVDFVGEKSATVTLEPGTYTFQCDPHASSMNGTFTVT